MEEPVSYLFQRIVDNSIEDIIVTVNNNEIFYINNSAKKLFFSQKKEKDFINRLKKEKPLLNKSKVFSWDEKMLMLRGQEFELNQLRYQVWYVTDITEQFEKDKNLLCMNTLVDAINEGIIASNSDGRIMLYNKQLECLENRSRENVLGKHMTEVYDVNPEDSEQLTVLKTGKPITDITLNYIVNGREMYVTSSTYPIIKNGTIEAVFSVSRDITIVRKLLLKTMDLQSKQGKEKLDNKTSFSFSDVIGKSEAIKISIKEAQKAAISPAPVLIYGETGTGKELFVQGIHNASEIKNEPFVSMNCAAIPETLLESTLFGSVKGAFTGAQDMKGLFEQAGKGTLYLDEVNSMPVNLQAKILRALQEMRIRRLGSQTEILLQCRIISSTNEEPYKCVEQGILRSDLYYRLAVLQLVIPPLRERAGDVEVLAHHFLKKFARIYGKQKIDISNNFLNMLKERLWPGNVRELEHVLESSIAMLEDENELTLKNVPQHLISGSSKVNRLQNNEKSKTLKEILQDTEKEVILKSLKDNNWNISRAAKYIGIGRQNMQYRMAKLNIMKSDKNDPSKYN
ncbi:MAG: sigma 54-interacting transcriptional regulator [Clostridiales bacterium]|nr:sigma 54-interacting transcriptional regulator [Clostridiales bacterium]MCF8023552.1 sigma 54-interacting transcriptional regulator [Clostridiales bacterium]